MKRLVACAILVFLTTHVTNATAQAPDILKFRGTEYALLVNPLEQYFALHKEKRPHGGGVSTALWRGYVAIFEVKDSLLTVADIAVDGGVARDSAGERSRKWASVVDSVFPSPDARVCRWFSGLLVLPDGKPTRYVHMGYGSLYEKYLVLRIVNGVFTKERSFRGEEYFEFRKRQFEAYKETDEYSDRVQDLVKEGYDPRQAEEFLFEYESDYTSKFLMDEL